MSFGMYGVPSPTDPPAPQSFYGIKHAFAKAFISGTDGSLHTSPYEFSGGIRTKALIWLSGYMAQGKKEDNEDALRLYRFIEDNPQGVHIWVGDWMDGPHGEAVDPEEEDDDGPGSATTKRRIERSAPQRIELEDHQMFGSGN